MYCQGSIGQHSAIELQAAETDQQFASWLLLQHVLQQLHRPEFSNPCRMFTDVSCDVSYGLYTSYQDGYMDHFEVYEEGLGPEFMRKHYGAIEAAKDEGPSKVVGGAS